MTSAWTRSCIAPSVRKDWILQMLESANLQDWATAVMLGAQDSPTSRITPRMKAALWHPPQCILSPGWRGVLLRLSLRWCTAVRAEMSDRHSEIHFASSYQRMEEGEEQLGVVCIVIYCILKTEVVLILSLEGHQFPESRVWTRSQFMWPKSCDLPAMMWTRLEQGRWCQLPPEWRGEFGGGLYQISYSTSKSTSMKVGR